MAVWKKLNQSILNNGSTRLPEHFYYTTGPARNNERPDLHPNGFDQTNYSRLFNSHADI